jgi:hypothetical protein
MNINFAAVNPNNYVAKNTFFFCKFPGQAENAIHQLMMWTIQKKKTTAFLTRFASWDFFPLFSYKIYF